MIQHYSIIALLYSTTATVALPYDVHMMYVYDVLYILYMIPVCNTVMICTRYSTYKKVNLSYFIINLVHHTVPC